MNDPFTTLGLDSGATAEAVYDARRRLAVVHHPDRGGDAQRMREINAAADAALRLIAHGRRRGRCVARRRSHDQLDEQPRHEHREQPDEQHREQHRRLTIGPAGGGRRASGA